MLVLVGATSACAGIPTTYNQSASGAGAQSFISYGATDRDLKVDVFGNPFPQRADEVAEAVASQMQAAAVGPGTHFTTRPGASAREGYRVVVAFAGSGGAGNLCAMSAMPSDSPRASNVVVTAALCDKDMVVTSTDGRVDGVAQVNDPHFAALMKQVAVELFPAPANWKD